MRASAREREREREVSWEGWGLVFTRRFRREEETRRRSMKGDRREGRGGLDSLSRTINMAAGQTTYVSADYRNFSEFYLSG